MLNLKIKKIYFFFCFIFFLINRLKIFLWCNFNNVHVTLIKNFAHNKIIQLLSHIFVKYFLFRLILMLNLSFRHIWYLIGRTEFDLNLSGQVISFTRPDSYLKVCLPDLINSGQTCQVTWPDLTWFGALLWYL